MTRPILAAALLAITAPFAGLAAAQDAAMSFFITSVNPGKGADLGGLVGADAHCAALAAATGVTGKTWRAYLSTTSENARDRIGAGPWVNAKGEVVARDLDHLHGEASGLSKLASLTETGAVVNGRGDSPNRHDILTGSDLEGRFAGKSCEDWTSGGEGSAMVGHHDRTGGGAHPTSWNAAHASRGCSLEALRGTGGDGLLYCFAVE